MLETGLLPPDVKKNALFLGNAGLWRNDALKVGLPVTSTPTAGARGLVVWPPNTKGAGSVGHVAFLEEVYPDGRVRITEANWPTGSGIKERILTPAQYAGLSFVRLENAQINSYNAPPATPGKQRQYIVRSGDTLSGIAKRELGDANRWREIQKVGGGTFTEAEALNLQVGQSVYLPVGYQTGLGVPVTQSPVTNPRPKTGLFTTNVVSQMFPGAPRSNIETYLPVVLSALEELTLGDRTMVLMALATIRAETAGFVPISEGQSTYNTAPGGRPFALYDFRSDLGNGAVGDGAKYKGRGFIQLTGKFNYRKYGQAIGLGDQLVNNPELANDPNIAARLLARFLKDKEILIRQALGATPPNYSQARKLVNGGSHGLDQFIQSFKIGATLTV